MLTAHAVLYYTILYYSTVLYYYTILHCTYRTAARAEPLNDGGVGIFVNLPLRQHALVPSIADIDPRLRRK
jgi:hypothetical protein